MNKFHSILKKYDALQEKMENVRSVNERLFVYREMEDFGNRLAYLLLPLVKTHQDYIEASEILELYPEFADIAEYLIDPEERDEYGCRSLYQGEEEYEYCPSQFDPYDDWASAEDLDEFIDDAVGVDLLESLRAQVDHQKCSNKPYHHDPLPVSDAEFYDKEHDLTWKDKEDLIFLESMYH